MAQFGEKNSNFQRNLRFEIISALVAPRPGSDGFTVEFFKLFWNYINIYMLSAIQCIFEHKELPISQRLGIISCLPKGDKPRQFLKNWRPITLLNVFYKIISSCISSRIRSTLDNLISETQSGFMKGRYIGENTRFIYDLMAFTESKNTHRFLKKFWFLVLEKNIKGWEKS